MTIKTKFASFDSLCVCRLYGQKLELFHIWSFLGKSF